MRAFDKRCIDGDNVTAIKAGIFLLKLSFLSFIINSAPYAVSVGIRPLFILEAHIKSPGAYREMNEVTCCADFVSDGVIDYAIVFLVRRINHNAPEKIILQRVILAGVMRSSIGVRLLSYLAVTDSFVCSHKIILLMKYISRLSPRSTFIVLPVCAEVEALLSGVSPLKRAVSISAKQLGFLC